uniref:Uncharacterized protein n=1 Tax=Arundo donax TaxID=35708 RepID=A0A0A8ZYB2_ARUDO
MHGIVIFGRQARRNLKKRPEPPRGGQLAGFFVLFHLY